MNFEIGQLVIARDKSDVIGEVLGIVEFCDDTSIAVTDPLNGQICWFFPEEVELV